MATDTAQSDGRLERQPTAIALLDRLAGAFEATFGERLLHRGRWIDARCRVGVGPENRLLVIDRGRPSLMPIGAPLCSWDFSVRGGVDAWASLWADIPPPGRHDLFALCKRGEMCIEGNLRPFMANLQYFKDLLSLPRGVRAP